MLTGFLIGNLGADAVVRQSDGRQFVSFRVAHNDSYVGDDGKKVERSQWVDCVMNCTNGVPAVVQYLTAGTLVCVTGALSSRLYSSPKDRCMKAGITLRVQKVELLGGQSDVVPRRLYDDDGVMHEVNKYYHCDVEPSTLRDTHGREFEVVKGGWVSPKANGDDSQG